MYSGLNLSKITVNDVKRMGFHDPVFDKSIDKFALYVNYVQLNCEIIKYVTILVGYPTMNIFNFPSVVFSIHLSKIRSIFCLNMENFIKIKSELVYLKVTHKFKTVF